MKITIPSGPQDRGKKPSVSSLARYAACPGSWRLEKDLPEGETSEDAARGIRIHHALAEGKIDLLTDDEERDIACRCVGQYDYILASLADFISGDQKYLVESRMWYKKDWSGQVDRIHFTNPSSALVVDWKTGRVGTDSAETNLQLRGYAVLVKNHFPHLTEIRVAMIQPLAGNPTMVCYTEEDLKMAENEIQTIFLRLEDPEAELNPTPEGCKYCKAKSICPALRDQTLKLAQVSEKAIVSELSNRDISYYLKASKPVESFISELEKEAKKRLSEGQEIEGCELTPGRMTRDVTDAQAVFGRIGDKITTEAFVECCKLSLPSLEKAYATATGLRAKEAKDELRQTLSGLIEETTGNPILKLK